MEPQQFIAIAALIDAYTATGNYAGLQQLLKDIPLKIQEDPRIRARVARFYLSQDGEEKAKEIYQELLEFELARLPGAITVTSWLAIALGEVEKAIDLMETSVSLNMYKQFWTSSLLRHNEAVKNHPRYLAHLRRMRLDDDSLAELHRRMSFD